MGFTKWFLENSWQILINIIGGILTAGVTMFFSWIRNNYAQSQFRSVFGSDVGKSELHLVYAEFVIDRDKLKDSNTRYLYKKRSEAGELTNFRLSIDRPISSCEIRSANYLSSAIGRAIKTTPKLTSDVFIKDRLDVSLLL